MKSIFPGLALLILLALAGWRLGKNQARSGTAPSSLTRAATGDVPVDGSPASRVDHSRQWNETMKGANPKKRLKLLGELMGEWSLQAPGDAWAALLRNTDELGGVLEPGLAGLAGSIFTGWALKDGWDSARQAAASAPVAWQESIGQVLGSLHGQMPGNQQDPEQLVQSLTDSPGPVRTGILSQALATSMGPALPTIPDWEGWLERLQRNGWSEEERETITMSVSSRAMASDPEPTAEWLLKLALTPAERGRCLNAIVWQWGQAQSAANVCGVWLNTQTLGPEADDALASFAAIARRDDPESAVAWAQRIQDASRREAEILNNLRQWQQRAPAAAAAAAERLGLKLSRF